MGPMSKQDQKRYYWLDEKNLAMQIIQHWKEFRPKLYREAQQEGSLQSLAQGVARQTLGYANYLADSGESIPVAWSEAMRDYALSMK